MSWCTEPARCVVAQVCEYCPAKECRSGLIALFGLEYPGKTNAYIVRQMVAALVKRDNLRGLGERYDQLAAQYPYTVEAIADAVKYTAGPVGSAMSCFLSIH